MIPTDQQKQDIINSFHNNLPLEYKHELEIEWQSYIPGKSPVPSPTLPEAWEKIQWRKHKILGFY